MARDLSAYNVPAKPCYSCPFAGREPIPLPPIDWLIITTNSSMAAPSTYAIAQRKQFAEADERSNKKWFCLIGIIEEPTDEAFNQAVAEVQLKRNKNNGNGRNDGKTENISETH
ncbi:hypothetical protein QUB11_18740 [Microcoleus sp. B6-A1]|uniref:hypothetical protein n=1 Tax=Microcoleus sp. B6-A1 TaxID=2818684 RepID=UPI002FD29D32